MALLEERLIRDEIDQDIYLNLRAKYDLEAKPFEPPPQLTPVQTSLPIPEHPPQPQPTVQAQQQSKPIVKEQNDEE